MIRSVETSPSWSLWKQVKLVSHSIWWQLVRAKVHIEFDHFGKWKRKKRGTKVTVERENDDKKSDPCQTSGTWEITRANFSSETNGGPPSLVLRLALRRWWWTERTRVVTQWSPDVCVPTLDQCLLPTRMVCWETWGLQKKMELYRLCPVSSNIINKSPFAKKREKKSESQVALPFSFSLTHPESMAPNCLLRVVTQIFGG